MALCVPIQTFNCIPLNFAAAHVSELTSREPKARLSASFAWLPKTRLGTLNEDVTGI